MTERETLLVVLVVLHVVEGALWLRHGSVLLRGWPGRFRWEPAGGLIGNGRGALRLLSPLPPFGEAFVTAPPPCAVSPDGVVFHETEVLPGATTASGTGLFFRWDDLRQITADEKTLTVNGKPCWRADNVHTPRRLADWLGRLAKTPPAERGDRIVTELSRQFDVAEAETRVATFRRETRWLRHGTTLLFVLLLVVTPAVVWLFDWWPAMGFLAPALLTLIGVIAENFRRLHRRRTPAAGDERFRLTLLCWMAPLVTMRAVTLLSRPVLEGFHPVAAAFALRATESERLAALVWRDLTTPRLPATPAEPTAAAVVAWHRARQRDAVGAMLRARGLGHESLEQPPAKTDPSHARFCPRCHAQFVATARLCPECGGLELREWV